MSWQIHYDKNYGIDKRSGYTLICNGRVVIQLASFGTLILTLFKFCGQINKTK